MDKVNLKWEVNMYNISHMKFNARSHSKITVPLAYKKNQSCAVKQISFGLILNKTQNVI